MSAHLKDDDVTALEAALDAAIAARYSDGYTSALDHLRSLRTAKTTWVGAEEGKLRYRIDKLLEANR